MADSVLIYGTHAVRHALQSAADRALELWVQRDVRREAVSEVLRLAEQAGLSVQTVPRATLDHLAGGARHQGAILRQRAQSMLGEDDLHELLEQITESPLLLVLEGIEDPHNLGACLRTANGAGVTAVIVPVHRGTGLTPVVRKVASGAVDATPLIGVRNLARTLRALKERGIWIVGTSEDAAQSVYESDLRGPLALLMGGEQKGLRRLSRELCDTLVSVPMAGVVESLNVAVAAAVCLYEAWRQRRDGDAGGK